MDQDKIQDYKNKLKAKAAKEEYDKQQEQKVRATVAGSTHVAGVVKAEAEKSRNHTQKVKVTNAQKVEVEHTTDFKPLLKALGEVKTAVSKVAKEIKIPENEKTESVEVTNLNDYTAKIDEAISAIKAIELSPNITVQAPKVTVPKLDLQPLIDVMSEKETKVSIDLEDFRAQDINNEEIGIQYIGFVHPSGAWYIIKNEVEENKMRYKFGKSDYEKFFVAPDTYEYTTLDRAIYEIQA